MTMISQYYAKVSLSTDLAALKKVDRYLKLVEAKMLAFQKKQMARNGAFNINFKFNTNRLQFDVQKAFNDVSRRISFPINRFDVNRTALSASINSAVRTAMASTNATLRINPRVNQIPQQRGTTPIQQLSGRHAAIAGGAAGILGRYGAPAVLGGAALYGGAALNRANQEAMSMRLTTQAVVQAAGGTEQQGKDAFGWLRNLANEVGFSYKEAAPDFNQFLANAQGAGLNMTESQNIFQGLSEYQTAMGVTPARRKLVMNAASQMLGKQTLSMEELRRQMAESLPGTMDIFGEAYAQMTGSGLVGPDALKALYEAVPTGTVKSAEILKYVDVIMRRRAAPKLDIMKKTSIAEQGRAQNLISDFMNIASEGGLEQGFSRIFRTFTDGLSQSEGLVKSLASGFNEITKSARDLLLIPQSFSRMLQGKDSLIADKFFPSAEDRAIAIAWMESFKTATSELSDFTSMVYQGWKDIFSLLEASTVLQKLTAMNETLSNAFGFVNALGKGDTAAMGKTATGFGNAAGSVLESLPLVGPAVRAYNATDDKFKPTTWTERFLSDAKNNAYAARDQRVQEMSQLAGGRQGGIVMRDINVEITGADFTGQNPSEAAQQLADKIVQQAKEQILGEAWQMYPQTQ